MAEERRIIWVALGMTALISACASAGPAAMPPLVTDRPDFTESAVAVPAGAVQAESGYTYGRNAGVWSHSAGELLLRVGTGGGAEVRLGAGSIVVAGQGAEPRHADASLGGKLELLEGEGAWPQVALLAGSIIPAASSHEWLPAATLCWSWDLPRDVGVGMNFTSSRALDAGAPVLDMSASVAVSFPIRGGWGAFAEYFTFNTPALSTSSHHASAGVTLMLLDGLQLDARVGRGFASSDDAFAGVGLSRRWRR